MSAREAMGRRLRTSDDSGISMVELLVAMMLSAILLAMVGSLFVTVLKATMNSNQTRDAATVAGNVANELSKSIRFAVQNPVAGSTVLQPAILEATPDALTLTSLADTDPALGAPAKVRFSVVDEEVLQERWSAVDSDGLWTFPAAGATVTRHLGGTILSAGPAGQPMFAYLDDTGAELVPAVGGLTAEQRAEVAAITLTVRVRSSASPDARPTVIENTVGMPNLVYAGEDL